jgi:predicted FMN-binding regulatory protein PaiB
MHIKRKYALGGLERVKSIVRAHPFATLVTADLHIRGTPQPFADSLPVLRRTVDHFEAVVERPWSLDRLGEEARGMAEQVIAFRLPADSWYAEAKLSQDKPEHERARVLAGLEEPGPYANAALAHAMRHISA